MNTTSQWISYNELAWVDTILVSPGDQKEETNYYSKLINENAGKEVISMLHFGCGAGMHDYTFKNNYKITGVDLSDGMLDIAREQNPEITYYKGDMRTFKLNEKFDAVVIPDSIAYMSTVEDLRKTIQNANFHLKPGGVLFIVCQTKEEFRENNFVYTGKKNNTEITIFENNYIVKPLCTKYEATIVYLIRSKGNLEVYNEKHLLGLFEKKTWQSLLMNEGFEVSEYRMDHLYDRFIMEEGEYRLTIFVCKKLNTC